MGLGNELSYITRVGPLGFDSLVAGELSVCIALALAIEYLSLQATFDVAAVSR